MFIVKQVAGKVVSLPVKEIKPKFAKILSSKIAEKILRLLAEKPAYPRELAKKLREDEQKIYYYIRRFEQAGIVDVVKQKQIGGAQANVYAIVKPAFLIRFKEFELGNVPVGTAGHGFLEHFVQDGVLNAYLVVGSPDPHGPEMARSRDGYYGIDFALFLGTFLSHVNQLNVRLDTEIRNNELENNLILIGGPVVNMITAKVNKRLPIRFVRSDGWMIESKISGKRYYAEESGVIELIKNPFNKRKKVLVIAGKRYSGTRAAIIAFLKYFDALRKGNKYDSNVMARVVEGVDKDADGIVDDVIFLE
ncbi:hypothetical protein DRJ16_03950 [Candidatus Woesearchaeota archaeon]|nr:MAG: hypothetical protein DRJ16_03950 [Candidatus Woesearchaeota archaeon]